MGGHSGAKDRSTEAVGVRANDEAVAEVRLPTPKGEPVDLPREEHRDSNAT